MFLASARCSTSYGKASAKETGEVLVEDLVKPKVLFIDAESINELLPFFLTRPLESSVCFALTAWPV